MKILIFILLSFFTLKTHAVDLASCSNPIGKAYYPELGAVKKKDSGWADDSISNGIIKLLKDENNNYDILFLDATKQIISSVQDGGKVFNVTKGKNSSTFIVIFPGKTIEIFTFIKNASGILEYLHITDRSGDYVSSTKASLMRGECMFINFDIM